MSFPPRFLDELRTRVPLSGVAGRRVRLQRRGREFSGLCPFHNEKTPSFTINDDKGFFHCFGCGAHGDVITFEMRSSGLSFPDAIEKLAAEAGLEVPQSSPEDKDRARRHASLHEVVEAAAVFFEKQLRLPAGRDALDYLRRRGLDDDTIARFRLGFAPGGNALKAALRREEVGENLMAAAGLIGIPEDGRPAYDVFRDRVMFPITDRRGRAIAFGGRVMGDGQPKYLNSPDTDLFQKGHVLYGLAQARGPALEKGTIVVTEGYMDVIALSRSGFAHAVAPLGTALTEPQIEELWRQAPEPILCFDGDAAGRRAAQRAAERALPLLRPGLSLRFAMLPQGKDPDDLLRGEGASAMAAILDGAIPLSEAVWRGLIDGRKADTPERRAALEKDARDMVGRIGESGVRQNYEQEMRRRIRESFFPRRIGVGHRATGPRRGGKWVPSPSVPAPEHLPQPNIGEAAHQAFVAFLLENPALLIQHFDEVASVLHAAAPLAGLIEAAVAHLSHYPDAGSADLAAAIGAGPHGAVLSAVLARMTAPHRAAADDPDVEFRRKLALFQDMALAQEIEALQVTLASTPSTELWQRRQALEIERTRIRSHLE